MQPERSGGLKGCRDKISLNVLQAELPGIWGAGGRHPGNQFLSLFRALGERPAAGHGLLPHRPIHPDPEPIFYAPHDPPAGRAPALDLRWGILVFPILAGLASAMDQFIWNTSLKFTQAANATLLGNTSPLWVALIAWLIFRERTRRLFWLGLVLVMGGAAVVLGNDFLRHPTVGLGGSAVDHIGFLLRPLLPVFPAEPPALDTLSHVWLCSLSSTLVLLVICLVSRTPLSGYPTRSYLVMLGAALLPQLTGYLAIGYALGHIPAAIASPTMLGQPVITAILAIPILGERLTPPQWIGGLVALTGIYLVNRSREKPAEAAPLDEADGPKGSAAEGKGRQALDRRLDPK